MKKYTILSFQYLYLPRDLIIRAVINVLVKGIMIIVKAGTTLCTWEVRLQTMLLRAQKKRCFNILIPIQKRHNRQYGSTVKEVSSTS